MEKKIELKKLAKKGSLSLIVGLIFVFMGLGSCLMGYLDCVDKRDNPIDFLNVSSEEDYGKVEVSLMTDYFAVDEKYEKEKVYIVFDEENHMYLASINEESLNELNDLLEYSYDEEKEFPGTVVIKGRATTIPDDLKELAINYYNETFDTTFLNMSNFSTYLGNYYLDTNVDPVSENLPITLMVAGIFVLVGAICLFAYLKNKRLTKRNLEKYQENLDKLEEDLNSESTMKYEKYKVFLTDKFIVAYSSGLDIIDYQDVVWLYPQDINYRGNITRRIYVVTKDSKLHTVCAANVSKKTKVILDEIYEGLLLKLPNALAGYTNENRLKVKELYTKNK